MRIDSPIWLAAQQALPARDPSLLPTCTTMHTRSPAELPDVSVLSASFRRVSAMRTTDLPRRGRLRPKIRVRDRQCLSDPFAHFVAGIASNPLERVSAKFAKAPGFAHSFPT